MRQLTDLNSWKALNNHATQLRSSINIPLLPDYPYPLVSKFINLDISSQRIDAQGLELLFALAEECHLTKKINALITGVNVNKSENRPALHTALRVNNTSHIFVDNKNIVDDIIAARNQMFLFSNQIRQEEWRGYTGKPITHIINIGAGGSDLGPRFCIKALSDYTAKHLSYGFISDIDPTSFNLAVENLNPETTLFIISSKTFATKETLENTKKAFLWMGHTYFHPQHFIAVTANAFKAQQFGIEKTLPIWDWIGGRFSLCSAINLITCIAIGSEQFSELLAGANNMDTHFQTNGFYENMPVMLALLGIWNINFLTIHNHLLLIYANKMEKFVAYIQQLDMESNGKSIDLNNQSVNYATGPLVWGGLGNQIQHSYYQLLCQGTHKVAADFISINAFDNQLINKFCAAKIDVLSKGIPSNQPNLFIPGGTPINHLSLESCSPFALGELVALYEHKIYTQSVIWNINPFDQPGVESAKQQHRLVT